MIRRLSWSSLELASSTFSVLLPDCPLTMTSSTSTPISINLTEDQIDDILFCARTNEHADLLDLLKEILNSHLDGKQSQDQDQEKELMTAIIAVAKTDTGNSAWHYAAANGHTGQ